MNAKFGEAFNAWISQKKYSTIPSSETYDKILDVLLKYANSNDVVLNQTEKNWVKRSEVHFKYLNICFFKGYALKQAMEKPKYFTATKKWSSKRMFSIKYMKHTVMLEEISWSMN